MTDTRILELLHSLNKKQETLPFGAKYIPEYVESYTKTISKIIYGTLKVKSISATTRRLDLLQCLQQWCQEKPNHIEVNDDNLHCFLKCLKKKWQQEPSDDGEFQKCLEALEEESNNDTPQEFLKEIILFYEYIDKSAEDQQKSIDEILKFDQEFLDKNTFELFTVRSKIAKEPIDLFLKNILKDEYDIYQKHEENTPTTLINTSNYREAQINAAYALLNLNKSNDVIDILKGILKHLQTYEKLEKFEIDFLNYLFQKSDNFSNEFGKILLEKFPLLYEIPFIQLCTKILKGECNDICNEIKIDATVSRILNISKVDKKLVIKIRELLYELLSLSNYNNNIVKLIENTL